MADQRDGLFFSSLHLVTQETTADPGSDGTGEAIDDITPWRNLTPNQRSMASQVEPLAPQEEAFRHRGWHAGRNKVLVGLGRSGIAAAGIERFLNCGSGARVECSADGQRWRLRANYCHHRFCKPCAAARARIIRENLLRWSAGKQCLFITLTIRPVGDQLKDSLDHLYQSFARLREQKAWKQKITGGAYFCELTRGRSGSSWHVHLHILAVGSYWHWSELSDGWQRATGGSHKVDIQRAGDLGTVGRYVTSYATKGVGNDVINDDAALVEAIVTLRGRRLCQPFGKWGRLSMEHDNDGDIEWRRVGRLVEIVTRAGRGDISALGVLRALGVVPIYNAGKVDFIRIRPEEGKQMKLGFPEPPPI